MPTHFTLNIPSYIPTCLGGYSFQEDTLELTSVSIILFISREAGTKADLDASNTAQNQYIVTVFSFKVT